MNAEQPGLLPHQTGICPFCGTQLAAEAEHCEICGSRLDPLSRQQAQNQMGPWFVRDPRNPFFPGRSLQALLRLVESGELRRESIIRGPTTRQFWRRADQVPGVAHHVGVCHVCNEPADPNLTECNTCGAEFPEPDLRLDLGLAPMRSLPKVGATDLQSPEVVPPTSTPTPTSAPTASPPPAPAEPQAERPAPAQPVSTQIEPDVAPTVAPRRSTKRGGGMWTAIGIGAGSVALLAAGGTAYTIWGPGSGDRTREAANHQPDTPDVEEPRDKPAPPTVDALSTGALLEEIAESQPDQAAAEAEVQMPQEPEIDARAASEAALRTAIRSAEGLSEGDRAEAAAFPELDRAARIRSETNRAAADLP